jgi:prepilin-type processing-associated H-X9-DG protein
MSAIRRLYGSRPVEAVDSRRGATMVELLVVIAVITTLFGMLLPGLQQVRESGRLVSCRNNLRQGAIGLHSFHDVHRRFPYGGWGHRWVGVPELGGGREQPGGWIYCILPFLEETELHVLGVGLAGSAADDAYSDRLQTPVPALVCPSRRECRLWPVASGYPHVSAPKPFGAVSVVARADYAINTGTSHVLAFGGPADVQQGGDLKYWRNSPNPDKFTGISHLRNAVSLRSITDGASKTYLIGEKYVKTKDYATGTSSGDNESLYAGYCTDLHRFAGVYENVKLGMSPYAAPLNDHAEPALAIPGEYRFGSAHSSGCNMAYCDGSVQLVSYEVSPEVHFRAGHRADDGVSLVSSN